MLRYYECYGGTIDRTLKKKKARYSQQYSVGVRWLINCFKTTTFCQLQHCRNSPKTMIYCMQDWKRFHHHRSNEYIMVSNALGGVNGSRLSRHFPLRRRPVPTGIASWLTWRCTRSLQLLRLVSQQTNDLSCSNQEIDKISIQGQNHPFMLDRGLLDFLSTIDTPCNVGIGGSNEIWRYHRSELRPSQSDSKISHEG